MNSGKTRALAILATLLMAFTLVSIDYAEARRGGSFGSRGTRTFQQAPATRTAPAPAAPVERSMTPSSATRQQPGVAQQRPGMFNGLGGSLLRGVLIGGVIGMLLGYGFGGMAGMLGFILQLLLIGLVVMLAMRFLRSRRTPATAAAAGRDPYGDAGNGSFDQGTHAREAHEERAGGSGRAGGFTIPGFGGTAAAPSEDIELTQADLDTFERMLREVQTAFANEDHAALRRLTTPEMVSYLSEELAENAQQGLRNDVSRVHLLQADVAEAWREESGDYATAAFLYESVDVMRDRTSGDIVSGDPSEPTATTELWTFTRPKAGAWKLSAIQEVSAAA